MAPRFKRPLLAVPSGNVDEQTMRRWMTQVSDTLNEVVRLFAEGRDSASKVLRGNSSWAEVDAVTHGELAGGDLHDVATTLLAGFMSASDKAALSALSTSVTALDADVTALEARADISRQVHLFFHLNPGSGSGSGIMSHAGQTATITNSPLVAPANGQLTAIRMALLGTIATPASGTLNFHIDKLNATVAASSLTVTMPATSGTAALAISLTAGELFRVRVEKSALPTSAGEMVVWLTFTPTGS